MKKYGIFIVTFVLLIAGVCGLSAYSFFNPQTVSLSENRTLQTRPDFNQDSWFDGSYATQLNDFISDHIFRRETLIFAAQQMEGIFERELEVRIVTQEEDLGGDGPTAQDGPGQAPGAVPGSETQQAPLAEAEQDYLILKDRILSIFNYQEERVSEFSRVANRIFGLFPDYMGKYCLVAPTRIAFEKQEYAQYSHDQRAAIQQAYDELDPLVVPVDAYSKLDEQDVDQIYFRTDHHWSHFGAYFGAQALWEAQGKEYIPIEEYEKLEDKPFAGYLHAKNPTAGVDAYPDELVYYVYDGRVSPRLICEFDENGQTVMSEGLIIDPERSGHSTFLGSTYAYAVADGRLEDGSSLLLISDSFGNALSPWLAENYDTVVVVDPRFFTPDVGSVTELAAQYESTDVMIVLNSGAMESAYFISCINKLAGQEDAP